MTKTILLLLLTAAVIATGAAAAPADAAFFRMAKFRVEVEGVQTTKWETHHVKQGRCDSNSDGSGTEVVRFRSKRPVVFTLYAWNSGAPMWSGGRRNRLNGIDLLSRITRHGTLTHSGGEVCSYGDGTGSPEPPAPDCGTKTDGLAYFELRYSTQRRNLLHLEQGTVAPLGPFKRCPTGGISWPSFLDRADGREVGRVVSPASLFRYGKNVVLAAGRQSRTTGEHTYTTTIRWTLSLTRLGKVKQG